jgi:hypothetical protein
MASHANGKQVSTSSVGIQIHVDRALIPIPIPRRVRHIVGRLRQTLFHAKLTTVGVKLVPDWIWFVEACLSLRLFTSGEPVHWHLSCATGARDASPKKIGPEAIPKDPVRPGYQHFP